MSFPNETYTAYRAWIASHAAAIARVVGPVDVQYDHVVTAIAAAVALGDGGAITLGMDFLTVDPKLFGGRGAKSRMALVLRRQVDQVDRAGAHRLAAHWLSLFAREVVPQEGERVARLIGAFGDAAIRERALQVPIVLPWVERCIWRIVPDLHAELWRRAPAAVRDGDRALWRAHWTTGDGAQLGRAISASVPPAQRRHWAMGVIAQLLHDQQLDAELRQHIGKVLAGDFAWAPWDRSWQVGRLRPRPDTWPSAVVSMAKAVACGWGQVDHAWRVVPLLRRACEGRSPAYVEACWQALVAQPWHVGDEPKPRWRWWQLWKLR
jgi:hypothetical protein